MNHFISQIKLPINGNLYLKDPFTSELGQSVIHNSIKLIDELGFERFTFKKLALEIGSTEASIYRYFESKHKLLLYLINWYWGYIATRLFIETKNLNNSELKLRKTIHVLTSLPNAEDEMLFVDEQSLKKIVINESAKVFLTKEIDIENKEGVFSIYKRVVNEVVSMIKEINPMYPFPNMLVSNMIEGSNQQRFFADHLPRLTNSNENYDTVEAFYQDLIFKAIQ